MTIEKAPNPGAFFYGNRSAVGAPQIGACRGRGVVNRRMLASGCYQPPSGGTGASKPIGYRLLAEPVGAHPAGFLLP